MSFYCTETTVVLSKFENGSLWHTKPGYIHVIPISLISDWRYTIAEMGL